MILVFGASGNIGTPVVQNLIQKGEKVRAFVHSGPSGERIKNSGVTETYMGDFRKESDLKAAMEGCRKVFHVAPPFIEDEVEVGQRIIENARANEVEHLVFSSVLHPQLSQMDHHAKKLAVEESLIESGLNFNIVQPAMLMQNLRAVYPYIEKQGVFPAFSAPDKKLSLVDTADLGEAVATIFTSDRLKNATFELAGPDGLTYNEMVSMIIEELDQSITVKPLTDEERKGIADQQGFSDYAKQAFLKMAHHYDENGFKGGSSVVLEAILNRQPNGYRDFLKGFINKRA